MLTVDKYASGTKPRMESRVRRKVQARFGEGDTPYPQGSTVPTLRRDYEKAPHNLCKHRLSAAISRRAQELTKAKLADTNGQAEAPSQPAQPDAPTAPLPEAPASVNVYLDFAGRQVQLTLRDSDEGHLLQRLEVILQRFPAVTMPADATPQCPQHGAMKPSTKGKGWYCPHKLADGSWCKGK